MAKKTKRKGGAGSAIEALGAFEADASLIEAAKSFAASVPSSFAGAKDVCAALEVFPYDVRVSLISQWATKTSGKDPSSSALTKIIKEMTKDTPIFDAVKVTRLMEIKRVTLVLPLASGWKFSLPYHMV